jgi:hypothetical protein
VQSKGRRLAVLWLRLFAPLNKTVKLLEVLTSWQVESDNLLRDPAKLALLQAEDRAVGLTQGGQRKDDFSWQYVDYLYRS